MLLCLSSLAEAKWLVDISALTPEQKKVLLQKRPSLLQEKKSTKELDELLRELHSLPGVDRVLLIEKNPDTVEIEIQRAKRINSVSFAGLQALNESDAKLYFNIGKSDILDENQLIEAGERLRLAYKDMGFLNAVVDIEMPPTAEGDVDLRVVVHENIKSEISDISFESPQKELNQRLQRQIKSFRGQAFTESNLAELTTTIRKFLNKNGHIRTEINGPNIQFNSEETLAQLNFKLDRTEAYSLDYKGNLSLASSYLDDFLDLENYSSTNPNVASELSSRLRNLYLSKGFARIEIQTEEMESTKPFQKRILFNIDEGAKIKIEKINVSGRFSKSQNYYEKFIRKNSSDIISNGFYNKEDFDVGLNNLVIDLRNQGFLLAKVISTRTQYNRNKDQITLYINLDEGPLTRLEQIEFIGNKSFSSEELTRLFNLEIGGPLKLNNIETSIAALKVFYQEHGYIEMMLLNEKEDLVIYSENNTKAKVQLQIFEGPQVRVGTIVLDGNSFTKDYVILNELEFSIGDTVTPSKIEESISRLQRVGHFSTVEIRTLEEKTNVSNRTLIVRVNERNPGVFNLGFGATNERQFTLRGYTGVAYSNIMGTGRGVSLRLEGNYNVADIKYLESKITLGYLEPYLFNTRVRGRVNVTRSSTVTDYDLRQVTELNQTTYSVEKDFTSHILGIWDVWSLATVRDFGIDNKIFVQESLLDIATTGPTIEVDFRDNIFNPAEGTMTRLSAEYSSPRIGSTRTIEYWKSTASFTHYYNISKKQWVWANSVRGGFIENLSPLFEGGIPYDKKGFILGGRSTIRGYEAGTSEVFPNRSDLKSDRYILTTRAQMYLLKSEIRFPIYGNFAGALFYDGGSVRIQGLSFEDDYRDTVGFGLRYNTPVGPLNLEFGWKLDRRENEEPWRFHLSIGTF